MTPRESMIRELSNILRDRRYTRQFRAETVLYLIQHLIGTGAL